MDDPSGTWQLLMTLLTQQYPTAENPPYPKFRYPLWMPPNEFGALHAYFHDNKNLLQTKKSELPVLNKIIA